MSIGNSCIGGYNKLILIYMKMPETLPLDFIEGFSAISIDASSMIYLLKIGLLGTTAAEIKLFATEQIIREVGWPHLPVESVQIDNENLTNDESVVALALKYNIPVLSEDFEVLDNAGKKGLNYYNSLMVLNYLLLKKRIKAKEYTEYLKRLIEISHYSEEILEYGACIKMLVERILEI